MDLATQNKIKDAMYELANVNAQKNPEWSDVEIFTEVRQNVVDAIRGVSEALNCFCTVTRLNEVNNPGAIDYVMKSVSNYTQQLNEYNFMLNLIQERINNPK